MFGYVSVIPGILLSRWTLFAKRRGWSKIKTNNDSLECTCSWIEPLDLLGRAATLEPIDCNHSSTIEPSAEPDAPTNSASKTVEQSCIAIIASGCTNVQQ